MGSLLRIISSKADGFSSLFLKLKGLSCMRGLNDIPSGLSGCSYLFLNLKGSMCTTSDKKNWESRGTEKKVKTSLKLLVCFSLKHEKKYIYIFFFL